MNLLTFRGAEEALHDSVVIAIAGAAHADHDPVRSHDPPHLLAGILAAAIGVGGAVLRLAGAHTMPCAAHPQPDRR